MSPEEVAEEDETKGSRKRSASVAGEAEDSFDAAPKSAQHVDKPPAPSPKRDEDKSPKNVPAPADGPDKEIQAEFNASNEVGVGVQNKPSLGEELDPFKTVEVAKELRDLMDIAIDEDQYATWLVMLRAQFVQVQQSKPTDANIEKLRALWSTIKRSLPPQYVSADHPDLFMACKFNSANKTK